MASGWVSEIHVRYAGFELAELEGRDVELTATVTSMAGDLRALGVWNVRLSLDAL